MAAEIYHKKIEWLDCHASPYHLHVGDIVFRTLHGDDLLTYSCIFVDHGGDGGHFHKGKAREKLAQAGRKTLASRVSRR
jgi:hypothetical protein